jgi:hypothetical protein
MRERHPLAPQQVPLLARYLAMQSRKTKLLAPHLRLQEVIRGRGEVVITASFTVLIPRIG